MERALEIKHANGSKSTLGGHCDWCLRYYSKKVGWTLSEPVLFMVVSGKAKAFNIRYTHTATTGIGYNVAMYLGMIHIAAALRS